MKKKKGHTAHIRSNVYVHHVQIVCISPELVHSLPSANDKSKNAKNLVTGLLVAYCGYFYFYFFSNAEGFLPYYPNVTNFSEHIYNSHIHMMQVN